MHRHMRIHEKDGTAGSPDINMADHIIRHRAAQKRKPVFDSPVERPSDNGLPYKGTNIIKL